MDLSELTVAVLGGMYGGGRLRWLPSKAQKSGPVKAEGGIKTFPAARKQDTIALGPRDS
jgi:hypothetical protein